MENLMRNVGVPRIPRKERAVIHFVTEQAQTMMVFPFHRRWTVEIQNQQPAWIFQNPICFIGNAKQVFSIAQIQAETKHDDVKLFIIKAQLLGRTLTCRYATPFCHFNGLSGWIHTMAITPTVFSQPVQPRPTPTSNLENLRSLCGKEQIEYHHQ